MREGSQPNNETRWHWLAVQIMRAVSLLLALHATCVHSFQVIQTRLRPAELTALAKRSLRPIIMSTKPPLDSVDDSTYEEVRSPGKASRAHQLTRAFIMADGRRSLRQPPARPR